MKNQTDQINQIVNQVMSKKPYSFINKNFVKKISLLVKAKTEREKVKRIRAKLRKIATSSLSKKFYRKFQTIEFKNLQKILYMHRSTRERLGIYPWLVSEIKKLKARKIIDLGCGFNLIALYHFNFIPKSYIGYDIDEAIVKFINRFVLEKKLNVNAKAFNRDILEMKFQKVDLYLCLKVFDALEDVSRDITLSLLERISKKTGHIIASFSNRTLSGRKRLKERRWFENMLSSLNLNFTKHVKGNETFYLITV